MIVMRCTSQSQSKIGFPAAMIRKIGTKFSGKPSREEGKKRGKLISSLSSFTNHKEKGGEREKWSKVTSSKLIW